MDVVSLLIHTTALSRGYTQTEVAAGHEFFLRKNRLAHPPGDWDKAGRFFASERTSRVASCRPPSRVRPNSQMLAARTAAHCAELYGTDDELAVKRVARAFEMAHPAWEDGGPEAASKVAKAILKLRHPVEEAHVQACPYQALAAA